MRAGGRGVQELRQGGAAPLAPQEGTLPPKASGSSVQSLQVGSYLGEKLDSSHITETRCVVATGCRLWASAHVSLLCSAPRAGRRSELMHDVRALVDASDSERVWQAGCGPRSRAAGRELCLTPRPALRWSAGWEGMVSPFPARGCTAQPASGARGHSGVHLSRVAEVVWPCRGSRYQLGQKRRRCGHQVFQILPSHLIL